LDDCRRLPRRYDENVSLTDFARALPAMLDNATRQRPNVIIRPHGEGVTLRGDRSTL
jgi:hypothetical protein